MHDLLLIAVIAFVTLLTRYLPFLVFKNKSYPVIEYLGDVLPYAIMAMLVVYCLSVIFHKESKKVTVKKLSCKNP